MITDEIKGVLREHKKTNELWMNPNDIVECLTDLLASRESLERHKELLQKVVNKEPLSKCDLHDINYAVCLTKGNLLEALTQKED